jgi:hypothetical protein
LKRDWRVAWNGSDNIGMPQAKNGPTIGQCMRRTSLNQREVPDSGPIRLMKLPIDPKIASRFSDAVRRSVSRLSSLFRVPRYLVEMRVELNPLAPEADVRPTKT